MKQNSFYNNISNIDQNCFFELINSSYKKDSKIFYENNKNLNRFFICDSTYFYKNKVVKYDKKSNHFLNKLRYSDIYDI